MTYSLHVGSEFRGPHAGSSSVLGQVDPGSAARTGIAWSLSVSQWEEVVSGAKAELPIGGVPRDPVVPLIVQLSSPVSEFSALQVRVSANH